MWKPKNTRAFALAATLLLAASPCAVAVAETATLEKTDAFDKAFATSYYAYDACGDSKHGKIFRDALIERFQDCPFTPAARLAFKQHGYVQRKRSARVIAALIDDNGGLPLRLEGMTMTCREQQQLPDYVAVRDKLDRFAIGDLKSEEVLQAPCDAEVMAP